MCLKCFESKSDFCISAIEIPGRVIKWDSLAITFFKSILFMERGFGLSISLFSRLNQCNNQE